MQFQQDNSQRHLQAQKIGPHLIHANAILQCSNTELLQLIEQEQQINPALDSGDAPLEFDNGCPYCPGNGGARCHHCPFNRDGHPLAAGFNDEPGIRKPAEDDGFLAGHGEYPNQDNAYTRFETDWRFAELNAAGSGDPDFDPTARAHAPSTLADQLLSHLRATAGSSDDVRIAEYLVGSLDERGYLQINIDEAAGVLAVDRSAIEDGIRRLQSCDPPGIGARDLHDCLLLQMDSLLEQCDDQSYDPIAHLILKDHWEVLTQRREDNLPRRLRVKPEQVKAAIAFIQNHLTPHPAAQFRLHWDHKPDNHSQSVRPDVVISRNETGFKVEIPGFEQPPVQINPHYQGLYDTIRNGNSMSGVVKKGAGGLTPEHESHIVAYVERANLFLKNLQRRRKTIQKIAAAIIEYQQGFLETGQRSFLRPLTRTLLAERVGLHESTISRALLHKFVQLPTQDVVSFDVFFESGANAKEAVSALIAQEDRESPLSDQMITDELRQRGMALARRTVVKYREELRIPASYLRRRRKDD